MTDPTPLAPTAEAHLTDYWQILRRRRSVIFAFFIICFTTVTLGTFLMKPLYEASATLIVEGESTNISNPMDAASDISNINIFENYIETQIALIKSDTIAGRVFEEFKLKDTPRYQKRVILGKKFKRRFSDDIYIERLRDTRMISITVYNPDPQMAADIANGLADLYSQDNRTRRALTFIRNQQMGSLNTEYLRLQSKLEGLSNTLGPKHPEMIALKKEITDISSRINRQHPADSTQSESQELLTSSLLKIQQDSVLSSSKMNNIGIVDRAKPSNDIAKPRRSLNIALGIIFGLVGGVLLAFFVDYLDDSIKTDADLKRHLETVVYLGSLLSESPSKNKSRTGVKRSRRIDRLVHDFKDSPSAEAYRLLRTRILWSAPIEEGLKDVVILSSIPGEGKTTVASNLAIALTEINLKVLLVDVDLRKGRIHSSYDLSNDKGFANYLTEKLSLDDVVQKSFVPGLSIVTSGASAIEPSQLFASQQMKKFIEETRKRFDIVIYDTPPLAVISDAALLIPQVNGVILTVRSGLTTARFLKVALGIIHESHARLLGAVFNDSDSRLNRAYNHYYHSYQRRG